jgi:excinuclease ABC subunit B
VEPERISLAADPIMAYMGKPQLEILFKEAKAKMEKAASDLDFLQAARFRDEMNQLKERLGELEKV